jgi:hypothetical protein
LARLERTSDEAFASAATRAASFASEAWSSLLGFWGGADPAGSDSGRAAAGSDADAEPSGGDLGVPAAGFADDVERARAALAAFFGDGDENGAVDVSDEETQDLLSRLFFGLDAAGAGDGNDVETVMFVVGEDGSLREVSGDDEGAFSRLFASEAEERDEDEGAETAAR